ncbi:restriction endonuclease subunit S [Clostridium perfringens]|uniref:restriction endonuclease subunit S n=1 Tax=Clostridium perfringens TaxID=1502 RepID=UPI002AC62720|nr:restriction endonuclease subunit S [Clostridium perfringens]MDZ4954708.1 restriction endonuclease subunit S [Clostridium perfringens]MDZ5044119.1 restriction endonuclease subunit S [Clostridium perfringens]
MSRNVPKLRFNGFDGELKSFKFKQLVKLQRGSSPRPIVKYITDSDDGVNWIKIGDVSKGETIINSTKEKITKEGALKSRFVQVGDLILSNSMSYGRPYIMGIDGYIHDGWFVLRDYENNFKRDYLCQLLTSSVIQKQYKKLAAGGVVDNISSELVNSVSIKLPSLQEQEKIVNFLSKVDSIIEKQEKKVQYWNSYKKGMMQKIFSQKIRFKDENGMDYPEWKINKIENIATIEMGFTPSTKNDEAWNGNIEWLSIAGMNSKYIYSGNKKISSEILGKRKLVPIDTLIMSFKLTIGRLAIVKKEIVTNEAICQFYWKSKDISNEYMYAYLSVINIESFGCRAAKGITLNTESLNSIVVKLPCLEEQTKIANFLSNIDNIIEKESKKLEELKQWKKGLLQQLFV